MLVIYLDSGGLIIMRRH